VLDVLSANGDIIAMLLAAVPLWTASSSTSLPRILEAPDLDAALATAATNPVVQQGGGLEVRPIHSGGSVEPSQA
jgi:hypothetical protein